MNNMQSTGIMTFFHLRHEDTTLRIISEKILLAVRPNSLVGRSHELLVIESLERLTSIKQQTEKLCRQITIL